MTEHETFVFLGQIRGLDNRIKRMEQTIEALKYSLLPGAVRYDKDKVKSSAQNPMEELFAKIDEYERELEELNEERAKAILLVDDALQQMKDCNEQRVLLEYYVGRISIPDIAAGMGYSVRHCLRLRNNGVSMLAEILDGGRQ